MGCAVDNLDLAESLALIEGFIRSGRPHRHGALSGNDVVRARRDPDLRRLIDGCDLINAEGRPLQWGSRLLGRPLKARVPCRALFEALMARAAQKGWRVFLLGAREEVVSGVARLYPARYPGLTIAGYRNGYWSQAEEEEVVAQISAARPDILFVAISSPTKEAFLARYQAAMKVPFAMGVGGTFDVAVGHVKRAPVWMQKAGLEWFYRFLQEPRRMFRRYFIEDMAFVALFAREWVRR